MFYVLPERLNRQEEIKKGLQFIQSSLPYFGPQKEYAIFLQKLIRNLFNEGNDLCKEGHKNDSINQYSEAVSVSNYALSEEIAVNSETLERLHVNRAACYSDMGLHEKALSDCEDALHINSKNLRALYCKSKALFTMERYKEAYEAIARCSLIAPKDESVVKLTQELALKLGLKIRKAYVRTQPGTQVTLMDATAEMSDSLADQLEPDLPELDDYNSTHSSFSASVNNETLREPSPIPVSSVSPSVRSVPDVGLFPSALGSDTSTLFPVSGLMDEMIGDELDRILDSVPASNNLDMTKNLTNDPAQESLQSRGGEGPQENHKASNVIGVTSRMNTFASLETHPAYPSYVLPQLMMPSLDSFSLMSLTGSQREVSILDHMNGTPNTSLADTSPFPVNDSAYFLRSDSPVDVSGTRKKTPLLEYSVNGGSAPVSSVSPPKITNSLEDTHEFSQACQLCFTKSGSKVQSYSYHPNLDHKCKKDIFIGRIKSSAEEMWKRIRPRPTKNQYAGQYYICKDVAQGIECTYPGCCTFAYCQEEIDVWTAERKGTFCRETLFGGSGKVSLTVPHLLQEYCGVFVFLCEKCFDHKPRIISQQNKDNPFTCSHPVSKHGFEENKCLVHMFRDTLIKYCKIRPYSAHVVLDLCRHEVRYGCLREDECFYAHSLVELRVWVIQKETGISFEGIVQESEKYWAKESSAAKPQPSPDQYLSTIRSNRQFVSSLRTMTIPEGCNQENFKEILQLLNIHSNQGYPNFNIKFVCGQCWRNGQVIEADRNRKYCSAKARHTWGKDRQVVLVMSNERKKWISIRPCPIKKPVQFEMCHHIVVVKKCQYVGNCAYAHSQEEKEIWTFMKDLGIQDMEKLQEKLMNNKKIEKGNEVSSQVNKQIHLPTDYAETTVDFHCWLCGKNCNSERQWKMHISSEKHKEKVFHSEDDQNIWQHRFPTGCFSICKRFLSGSCPDGEKCRFAHGNAELLEWEERRKVLRQKLVKARKDQLISPDDNDFGKYSFLINDFN